VWVGKGENQAQWLLVEAAARLLETCSDAQRQLRDQETSQESRIIDVYVGSLREVDRRQREFEQAVTDCLDTHGEMDAVLKQARTAYRSLTAQVQHLFITHLEKAGWPPAGRLANADVFDRLVTPYLQESGRRVALLLIDALRYELGAVLHQQLYDDVSTELQAAFAHLPSITIVGMASLLPGAGQALRLTCKDGKVVPMLGDQPLTSVTQRMDVLRKRYGNRFTEVTLDEFVRTQIELPATVELLVLRSTSMDNQLESYTELTPGLIYDTLKRIRVAIHKLAGLGFQQAVIATDHGFFLNTAAEAGDVCPKPRGNWLNLHERCLLGDGSGDASNLVLAAERLGIRGDFNQVAVPRQLVAYRGGERYYHGGASLQEAVVPVLVVRLPAAATKVPRHPAVTLHYRRPSRKITTRLPVIEVEVASPSADMFSGIADVEVLLEAHDRKGNVVGEARPGGPVNPATRTISIKPGQTLPITLGMQLEFEGKFAVHALDPTTLTAFCKLDLETDYTV
jgi:hypothetical protein